VTRRHRVLAGVVASLGWAVIAVLWVVTGARIVAWDKWEVFAALDAFTLVLFLPAWPIAVLALWRRRWVLAGASVLMAATQVVLVAPELSAARPLPRHLHGATKLRIFDANVYEANPSMAGYAAEIRRDRPDIVTLEEATPNDVDQLAARGALDRLPYQFWNRAFDSRSLVIISRYPLGPTSASAVDGQPYLARTTVEVPRRPLALWIVHTTAPIDPSVQAWNDELDGIHGFLRSKHPARLMVVGDFNATWGNRGFRAILATGLVDGAAARGDALDMTWSQLTSPLPPVIRIDHVLTGPDLVVSSIHSAPGPGSDHRALIATVDLLTPST
jgi:endonuclease/exonuclease/phosphatase (EEP) superfamily protein YafD